MHYNSVFYEDCKNVMVNIPGLIELKEKTIVVTGATGLVGSAIVDFLSYLNECENYNIKIHAACRSKDKFMTRFSKRENFGVMYLKYDALKPEIISFDADYVISAASLANPNAYITKPVETMLTNIIGTNEWLRHLCDHRNCRMVLVSSSEIYGQKEDSSLYSEGDYGYIDILNPRACYPSSKRAAETLCSSYHKEYGCDFVIVRLGHIYGPSFTAEDNRASSAFVRDVMADRDIIMKSNGMNLRSYCYSFDAVSALLCVMINGESGRAYNISSSKSVTTIRDFAETLAKISGRKVEFENPTDQERQSYNLMQNSALDASMLEGLGWSGVYDLEAGINHMIKILTVAEEYKDDISC